MIKKRTTIEVSMERVFGVTVNEVNDTPEQGIS